jgi:hypothetical protein
MFRAEKYGPWALIAGGSEGVAEAFAQKLGGNGINLVLVARKPQPLEDLAEKVRSQCGVQVRALSLDLIRADMLERIREVTDDIDIGLLIYNAGGAMGTQPFLGASLDDVLMAVQLNVVGQTKLAHHFAPKMVLRGRGGIIFIGSLAGNAGAPNLATYGGSKAFTQIFGEALWSELKPHGVDVLVQVLGATDTPRARRSNNTFAAKPASQSSDEVAQQALDELADGGPVITPPAMAEHFKRVSSMPRRQVAELMQAIGPKPAKHWPA